MKKWEIKKQAQQRLLNGERLLQITDFVKEDEVVQLREGELIMLSQPRHYQVLIARQHKGIGWVVVDEMGGTFDALEIEWRIQDSYQKRQNLMNDTQTTAYRLFNGEGDGIGGVTIDYYATYVQINWYSRGIYRYREAVIEALQQTVTNLQGIYETKRFELYDYEVAIEHIWGNQAPQPLHIMENGIQYAIYLGEEWMTGLFLDQREVRDFVRQQSQGVSVLNLFSYTGGFSVAAAIGGASKTVSVDVANRSLDKTSENFALNNQIAPSEQHEIRVMDVFNYLNYAKRHALQFDVVVCDPPSFARTKDVLFRAEKDYVKLASQLFDITAPGGMCIVSTNHSGYSRERFLEEMTQLGKEHEGQFMLIQTFGLPEDYPTSKDAVSQYLKVFVFYRSC